MCHPWSRSDGKGGFYQLLVLLDSRGGLNFRRHLSDLVLHALKVSDLKRKEVCIRRTKEETMRCRYRNRFRRGAKACAGLPFYPERYSADGRVPLLNDLFLSLDRHQGRISTVRPELNLKNSPKTFEHKHHQLDTNRRRTMQHVHANCFSLQLAELFPLEQVGDCRSHAALGQSRHLCAYADSALVQDLDRVSIAVTHLHAKKTQSHRRRYR